MNEFSSGDTVLIVGLEELEAILEEFSPNLDCIQPLSLHDIADQYATVLDVIVSPESSPKIEDFAVLISEEGQDFVLPMSAFRKVKVQIDELEESYQHIRMPISKSNPTVLSQELHLVQTAAAECIQSAFR